jgi:hypothetical protein
MLCVDILISSRASVMGRWDGTEMVGVRLYLFLFVCSFTFLFCPHHHHFDLLFGLVLLSPFFSLTFIYPFLFGWMLLLRVAPGEVEVGGIGRWTYH